MGCHFDENKMIALKEKGGPFLIGVTGGVASGKSVVSKMLEELGAVLIDFDILARLVVEPGRPAWREIVEYFGKEVLLADSSLNRKMLSRIVFSDEEKRKMLERFTHPKILDEFAKIVERYAEEDPGAIIQASVPLLFEIGLQDFFHRVLVVYVPEEIQIERLMKRDGITREMAIQIVRSQLPMEVKKARAHYVVDNSGSLSRTRMEVTEIWNELKKLRREITGYP